MRLLGTQHGEGQLDRSNIDGGTAALVIWLVFYLRLLRCRSVGPAHRTALIGPALRALPWRTSRFPDARYPLGFVLLKVDGKRPRKELSASPPRPSVASCTLSGFAAHHCGRGTV